MRMKRVAVATLAALSLVAAAIGTARADHYVKSDASLASASFETGVLPPPPPGSSETYNIAAEPQIRSSPSGRLYITSENGLGAGTDAWASNDGVNWTSLVQPNAISSADASQTTGVAPGGGDTDLSVAPVKNGTLSSSHFNVYVASLTLGSVTVSASQNAGLSWQSQVLGATVPADDREWIAAYGQNMYYLAYHDIASGDQIIVNEGELVNGVPTTVQTYSAINPAQTDIYAGTLADNEVGSLAVDQKTGNVYEVFVGCPPSPTAVASCTNLNTVYMAVGVPTGVSAQGLPTLSFTDYVVYQSPSSVAELDNNFANVAVDAAGNVYAAWSNDQNVYVAHSTDEGQTWSAPQQVNSGNAVTAIYPWMAAGATGKVDIVYYATPAAANYQTCGGVGTYDCQNEPWYVYMSQNLDATGGGTWSQAQVTGVVHYGGVCQGGVSCTSTGNDNRDLYDDFGVTASPLTGMASITYSDDQYQELAGTANAGACTSSEDNTVSCDHTDWATQVKGQGIY